MDIIYPRRASVFSFQETPFFDLNLSLLPTRTTLDGHYFYFNRRCCCWTTSNEQKMVLLQNNNNNFVHDSWVYLLFYCNRVFNSVTILNLINGGVNLRVSKSKITRNETEVSFICLFCYGHRIL